MAYHNSIDVHYVVCRILSALGLQMHVCKIPSVYGHIPGINYGKFKNKHFMRSFLKKDSSKVLAWYNNCCAVYHFDDEIHKLGGGFWTIFMDDDNATFQLFTKIIEYWTFENARLINTLIYWILKMQPTKTNILIHSMDAGLLKKF